MSSCVATRVSVGSSQTGHGGGEHCLLYVPFSSLLDEAAGGGGGTGTKSVEEEECHWSSSVTWIKLICFGRNKMRDAVLH